MHQTDTICSISTAPGEGGIGIIRISGADAVPIAAKVFAPRNGRAFGSASHRLHYGNVIDRSTGEIIDEALVSVMRAPATYTREDVVEINCHGGMMPLSRTLALVIAAGARQAEPGEFTKRAFLNGTDRSEPGGSGDGRHSRQDRAGPQGGPGTTAGRAIPRDRSRFATG